MISVTSTGSLAVTEAFVRRMTKLEITSTLDRYGEMGRAALAAATPRDSGLAAESWSYTTSKTFGGWAITWHNTDIENGFPVAISIQYGHGTGTGGYVQGVDYINPAIKPVMEQVAKAVWEEVTRA